MGTPRLQTSLVIANETIITVTQGGPPHNIATIAANTEFDTIDDLLQYLEDDLVAWAGPGTWTLVISNTTGKVSIWTSAGNFDWSWDADAEVRDWLGYTGNVVGQASPWAATNQHEGGFYPVDQIQRGTELMGLRVNTHTIAAQSLDGSHDSVAANQAAQKVRSLTLNIERESAGTWLEIIRYRAFLDLVRDRRKFTVWPDSDDTATSYTYQFMGPNRIPYRQRIPRSYRYFQVDWEVSEP